MLLTEIIISGTTYRVSNEEISLLTNPWKRYVVNPGNQQLNIKKPYGGYIELKVSTFELRPDFFTDNSIWPPSIQMTVKNYYTNTTEEAKELMVESTAHRKKNNRTSIKYKLYNASYAETLAKTTVLSGTLATNFATWATTLGLTLNTDNARATSPDVSHTTTKEWILIDAMSDMAAFFTHCFYIKAGVLYLIDMFLSNGSRTITEFDVFPSTYPTPDPVASASTANYARQSSYPYGKELPNLVEWHGTETNINDALDNIITISNADVLASVKVPLIDTLPTPMEQLTFLDTSLGKDSNIIFNPTTIRYNYNTEEIVLSGGGVLTASGGDYVYDEAWGSIYEEDLGDGYEEEWG